MTSISGWAYIAIGSAVALFSRYVQNRGGEGLAIFFWTGIIFIGIGVFKIASAYILKNEKKEKPIQSINPNFALRFNKGLAAVNEQMKQQNMYTGGQSFGSQRFQAPNSSTSDFHAKNEIISCPRCGTRHYASSNFCHLCGFRFR